jgi:hypothetical protein
MANLLDDEIPGFKYQYLGPDITSPSNKTGVTVRAPTETEMASIGKSKVNVADLTPDLKERVDLLAKLWKEDKVLNPKGEDLPLISGYRSREQQRQLYLDRMKNPNLVAPPESSRHVKGEAIDLHPRVPESYLAQVGLHRPYGQKDMPHVEINPKSDFQLTPYDVNMDEEVPGFKYGYNPAKVTAAEQLGGMLEEAKAYPTKFAKQAASTIDTALNALPAVAQWTLEPVAKLADTFLEKQSKAQREKLDKAAQDFTNPLGKAFNLLEDPAYKGEGARQIMEYVGEYADKGADWIAKNTGMDKRDASWWMNAAALKAAPTAGRVAKATAQTVGEAVTPTNIGNLISEGFAKGSATSPYANKLGFAQGFEKNPQFLEALKGDKGSVNPNTILEKFQNSLGSLKKIKNDQYNANIEKTRANQVFVDFEPIRKAFDEASKDLRSENLGVSAQKVSNETMAFNKKIDGIVKEWESKKALHTAGNLDHLKRRLDDEYSPSLSDESKAILRNTRNSVKDTIVKQSPEYAKTMKDYEEINSLVQDIEQTLKLGKKEKVDIAINRLQQLMSTKHGLTRQTRLELARELEKVGGQDLLAELAGYSLSNYLPSSLMNLPIPIIAAQLSEPTLLGAMALQSPKAIGYGSYAAGRTARAISDVGQAAKAQVEKGKTKLSEITSRK